MINEIRLNRQAGEALKKKLKQAREFFEEEERSLYKAERLAGGLYYAQMSATICQANKSTGNTLRKLESFQKDYEDYERAIEDWDCRAARLLNDIQYPDTDRTINNQQLDMGNDLLTDSPISNKGSISQVRASFEADPNLAEGGEAIKWQAGTEPGTSTITVSFKNGDTLILHEKTDYYIDEDWKAHFIVGQEEV